MQILQVLISLAPSIIRVAQQGQQAWEAFIEARKVQSDDDLNAKLDDLKAEFVRRRIIAEHEAGLI